MNQNIEIAFNFTREIPLKILPGFKILGEPGAEIVYLLLVGGWWLEVGGWWLVVGGWLDVFFFCTLRSPR